MVLSKELCVSRASLFDDSPQLESWLREYSSIAVIEKDHASAYELNEAADNLRGMYELVRSMAHHLRSK